MVALNEDARSWWERLGFDCFNPDDTPCLDLYLLTSTVEKMLGIRTEGG